MKTRSRATIAEAEQFRELRDATTSLARSVSKNEDLMNDLIGSLKEGSEKNKTFRYKPESFNGTPASGVITFFKSFEKYCNFNNLNAARRAETLPLLLEKSASVFYETLTAQQKADFFSKDKLGLLFPLLILHCKGRIFDLH